MPAVVIWGQSIYNGGCRIAWRLYPVTIECKPSPGYTRPRSIFSASHSLIYNPWSISRVKGDAHPVLTLPSGAPQSVGQYASSELPQIIPRLPPPGGLLAGREGSFLWTEGVL